MKPKLSVGDKVRHADGGTYGIVVFVHPNGLVEWRSPHANKTNCNSVTHHKVLVRVKTIGA